MKNKTFSILILFALFILEGCGGGSNQDSTQDTVNSFGTPNNSYNFNSLATDELAIFTTDDSNYTTIRKKAIKINDSKLMEYEEIFDKNQDKFVPLKQKSLQVWDNGDWRETGDKKYEISPDGKILMIYTTYADTTLLDSTVRLHKAFDANTASISVEVSNSQRNFYIQNPRGGSVKLDLDIVNENRVYAGEEITKTKPNIEEFINSRKCSDSDSEWVIEHHLKDKNKPSLYFYDTNTIVLASPKGVYNNCTSTIVRQVGKYEVINKTRTTPKMILLNFSDKNIMKEYALGDDMRQVVFIEHNGQVKKGYKNNTEKIAKSVHSEKVAIDLEQKLQNEFRVITLENDLKFIDSEESDMIANTDRFNNQFLQFSDSSGRIVSSQTTLNQDGKIRRDRQIYLMKNANGDHSTIKICKISEKVYDGCINFLQEHNLNTNNNRVDLSKITIDVAKFQ